ncbi:MAG: hypothetical protein RLZZ111_1235 [Planctomycetota bacterium]|jgi:hypothetical protein
MIAVTSVQRVSMHADPVGSWWFVAAVAAVLVAVMLAFPPDRSRVSAGRVLALVLLRLAAFLTLVVCMLRPTFVATTQARQQGTVVVLADASKSMTVADGPAGRSRWDEMTAALGAARQAAEDLVEKGDFDIVTYCFDRELRPVPPVAGNPFPLPGYEPAKTADQTAIGAAIEEAGRAGGGRPLAGVILLSDGAQHAYPPRDQPPQVAARLLADMGAPLWSVTFGQQLGAGQGRDAAVVNLAAGETVYRKNTLEVAGRVRVDGLADRDVTVRLLAENDSGAMEEVDRTIVKGGPQAEVAVRLAWTPQSLGERKLSLAVDRQEGEVVVTNNELSTFVEVVDGGLRVLYLEGSLRVEQRFLRRVLAASPDIQVDFRWIDSSRRDRWPVDLGRQLDGDQSVIVIGDLDAAALSREDLQKILRKVQAGAGLGLLGGFHAFEAGGWGSSALAPALPFEADRLARQPFDEPIRERLHLKGPLQMLPDARFGGVSILRQAPGDDESRRIWKALPPLEGANDLGRLVPAAKPLAVTADGKPILVGREYGDGRVLAFAADSTWRWAMQGAAEQHRRFWRQLVLWLAKQDEADQDSLWVRLAQRRISPGAPLPFDVGLTKPDGTAVTDVTIEGVAIGPAGQPRPVRIARRGETFSGTLLDLAEPGDWKLVVKSSRPGDAAPRERSARFTVVRQDLELANPRANPLLMRQLAEATGGGVRLPEELPGIFLEIAGRPAAFETEEQWSYAVWDKWPMLAVLAACLCTEWALRKRFGLV